jgi:hypothetical protein
VFLEASPNEFHRPWIVAETTVVECLSQSAFAAVRFLPRDDLVSRLKHFDLAMSLRRAQSVSSSVPMNVAPPVAAL